jgi:hypothetical protein
VSANGQSAEIGSDRRRANGSHEGAPARLSRGWLVAAAAFLAAMAMTSAADAQQPQTSMAKRSLAAKPVRFVADGTVQPGEKNAGYSLKCSKHEPHAIGGWITPTGTTKFGQISITNSSPVGLKGHSWEVGVVDRTAQPQHFEAGILCINWPGRFAYPVRTGTVPPGGNATKKVTCPHRAPQAINGYFTAEGTLAQATLDNLAGTTAVPNSSHEFSVVKRWSVGVRNVSTVPQDYAVGVVCVSQPLKTAALFAKLPLAPGASGGATLKCPRQAQYPIGSQYGQDIPPGPADQLTYSDARPVGVSKWSVGMLNPTTTALNAFVGVSCIS